MKKSMGVEQEAGSMWPLIEYKETLNYTQLGTREGHLQVGRKWQQELEIHKHTLRNFQKAPWGWLFQTSSVLNMGQHGKQGAQKI